MEGKTLLQRPMGPRTLKRNPLPSIQTNQAPDSNRRPALTIKPISAPNPPQPPPETHPEPARPPPPSLSLSIPRPGNARPTAPKIKLQINATSSSGPLFESYAGGPTGPPIEPESSAYPDEKTMRPPSTIMPNQKPADSYDSLRVLVETGLDELKISTPPLVSDKASDKIELTTAISNARKWTDADFDVLERLGEGAGGAVAKVRDKQTGLILARKTITTREAPMKQLQRELTIAASVEHINIIKWYGAYMSPSMSEIKIVMELCEGGSLESVGKRLRERGGVVGEKIAGRLAEGVRIWTPYLLLI